MIYAPDFEHLPPMNVVRLDAEEVPGRLWTTILTAHADLVQAQLVEDLPADADAEGIRLLAAVIVGSDDPEVAIDKYKHPNNYRGQEGTNRDQLYCKPRMTVVLDAENDNEFMAAVGTVINTSPTGLLPGAVGKQAEQFIKMHARPELPIVGGCRYDKVTGVVFVDKPAAALAGLHYAVKDRPSKDHISVYHVSGAAADAEMGLIVGAAGLGHRDTQYKTGIPGYPPSTRLDWYVASHGVVRANIEGYRGATEAIESMQELATIPTRWQGE